MFRSKYSILVGAAAVGTAFAATPAVAMGPNYEGKTVQIIAPTKEGGGTDRFARLLGRFLGEHLPGKPNVVVFNKPGGASVRGANWFEKKGLNDGTQVFVGGGSLTASYLFKKKIKFDLNKWRPVMLAAFGYCFYAHKDVGLAGNDIKSDIAKLRKTKPLLMGAKNKTSGEIPAFLAYDMLGLNNASPVFGLSSGKRRKATLRGETQFSIDTGLKCGKIRKFEKKGMLKLYMTMGILKDGKIVRDPMFPKLPTVMEATETVTGKKPTGDVLSAHKHLLAAIIMSNKTLWLRADTPEPVYQAYVKAVKAMLADKAFKKFTKKTFGVYPQAVGADAVKMRDAGLNLKPSTKKWILEWIDRRMVTGS